MIRDMSDYLYDIIDACDSISSILAGISVNAYAETREKRSAVERMAAYLHAWFDESPDEDAGIARAVRDIARARFSGPIS
jgi:hypothetical protein